MTRLRALPFVAAAFAFAAIGARAQPERGGESVTIARARVTIDGESFEFEQKIQRPQKPVADASLLVETHSSGDLAALALSRGMSVVWLDLQSIPKAARARALRDLASRLRETVGAKRVLAHGRADNADALLAAGAVFDGLLLHRLEPFAAPMDARGPKTIEIFTSDAYWRPGGAAVGPDHAAFGPNRPNADNVIDSKSSERALREKPVPAFPQRALEAAEGANRRRFLVSGVADAVATANCAAPVNTRSLAPALRALFVALDEWTKGVKPPPSRAPRLHESGLASANALAWPKIPAFPKAPSDSRPVPAIDADGNETGGLRLPDHLLPVATYTGFNARKDEKGPPCLAGAALPFASTKAERERANDPRPSLVERYGSRAYFVATMRVVADRLVKERLLLREDADAYVAEAKRAPF